MHCKNIDYHSNKNLAIKGPQYNLEITIDAWFISTSQHVNNGAHSKVNVQNI